MKQKKQEVDKLSAKADEKLRDFYTIKERGNWQDPMFFAMSAYIYRIDEGLQFCIKAIQDYAYSGFGGRGGKHGDIFWDNESYAIKHYLKMFADLASATLKQVADWFVWLASTVGRFNANELKRADHEVHDIADGRYDGRIKKYQPRDVKIDWRYNLPTAITTRASSAVMNVFMLFFNIVWFLFQQFVKFCCSGWNILLYNITVPVNK